ncbi:MAG: GNAT family protein [Kofleriaceae bacterium]
MPPPRFQIAWSTPEAHLVALEPDADEVRRHAGALADAYNDPHNAPLLGHTDRLGERDVVAHYAGLAETGHGFLTFRDGALVGDADLRGVANGCAELAFLVASVADQGKGLGTRIATMIHTFAFRQLALARVYASIVPANTASRRVFDKLGYVVDTEPAARAYADDPEDVVLRLDRAMFEQSQAIAMAEIQITVR